jgi:hypothetical protein
VNRTPDLQVRSQPVRQRDVERRVDDALPEPWQRDDGPFDGVAQTRLFGRAIEH